MITTLTMAAPIALSIHVARSSTRQARGIWSDATTLERLGLLLLLLPIPGPLDEIVGLLVVRRVTRRRA